MSLEVRPANKIKLVVDSMKGILIDDCVKLSRAIEHGLNREIEDFELEVSSPGLDSPFKVKEQYIKNIGKNVEVIKKDGKQFQGKLLSVDPEKFCVEAEKHIKIEGKKKKEVIKEKVELEYSEVSKIRLVISFK